MTQLEIALEIAREAHAGQKDKGGADYLEHPLYVSSQMKTEEEKVVALLHDVIEDGGYSAGMLLERGISRRCCEAVQAISRKPGEDYMAYIRRVRQDRLAASVKIQDLLHNSDLTRLEKVEKVDLDRLEKYQKALKLLREEE